MNTNTVHSWTGRVSPAHHIKIHFTQEKKKKNGEKIEVKAEPPAAAGDKLSGLLSRHCKLFEKDSKSITPPVWWHTDATGALRVVMGSCSLKTRFSGCTDPYSETGFVFGQKQETSPIVFLLLITAILNFCWLNNEGKTFLSFFSSFIIIFPDLNLANK